MVIPWPCDRFGGSRLKDLRDRSSRTAFTTTAVTSCFAQLFVLLTEELPIPSTYEESIYLIYSSLSVFLRESFGPSSAILRLTTSLSNLSLFSSSDPRNRPIRGRASGINQSGVVILSSRFRNTGRSSSHPVTRIQHCYDPIDPHPPAGPKEG